MELLPGWNSIEATARLQHVFVKSSLVLLALLVLALGLAYLYGHRRDSLSDEDESTRVNARASRPIPDERKSAMPDQVESPPVVKQTSPPPASAAPPRLEESRPSVASGQMTGEPNPPPSSIRNTPTPAPEVKRAPEFVATPLPEKPKAELPKQSPPAPERDVKEVKVAPVPATGKVREAESKRAASLETQKPDNLTKANGARHLNAEQRARLHDFLKDEAKGRLTIRVNPAVPDASNYGVELARFFKHETGWTVRLDNSPFMDKDLGGMWIALRSEDAIPPATGALHAALAHAHVPVRAQPVWGTGGPAFNEIWLVIGKRN